MTRRLAPRLSPDCPTAALRPSRSPIPAAQSAWIPKEVFRLSHTNNDWRLL